MAGLWSLPEQGILPLKNLLSDYIVPAMFWVIMISLEVALIIQPNRRIKWLVNRANYSPSSAKRQRTGECLCDRFWNNCSGLGTGARTCPSEFVGALSL